MEQVQVKNAWWSQIEQLNLNHLYSAKLYNFVLIIPKLLNSGLFQKGYLQSTSSKYTPAQPSPKGKHRKKALPSQMDFEITVFYMLCSHIHNSYHKSKIVMSFSEEAYLILHCPNLFDKETFIELCF